MAWPKSTATTARAISKSVSMPTNSPPGIMGKVCLMEARATFKIISTTRDMPRAVYKRVELCYTAGMKAYSQDLRQRVVRAVDAGQSQAEIAKTFAVSVATIKRYLKQRRETGHVLPKAIPGRPAKKGAVLQAHLRAQLEAHPDATREEH